MATKAINFKMDEVEIADMKKVASVYHITVTDIIKNAIGEYLLKLKEDPFYKLTANVEEADAEETAEVLEEINGLTDDDITIVSSKRFTI